jgi:hypothetical protein
LRKETHGFLITTWDVGFLPEPMMHEQAGSGTIFDMAQDASRYKIDEVIGIAEMAADGKTASTEELFTALESPHAAIRYWAILGLLIRGEGAVPQAADDLAKRLIDNSGSVAIVAAEALARHGAEPYRNRAMNVLVELADVGRHGPFTSTLALNALDAVGPGDHAMTRRIQSLDVSHPSFNERMRSTEVAARLTELILSRQTDDDSDERARQ